MIKERHAHEEKYYYRTTCPKCDSKFAFSEDDMTRDESNREIVTCPICKKTISHYEMYESVYSNFKKISYRKYAKLMKKYNTKTNDIDH